MESKKRINRILLFRFYEGFPLPCADENTGKNEDTAGYLQESDALAGKECQKKSDNRHQIEVDPGDGGVNFLQTVIPKHDCQTAGQDTQIEKTEYGARPRHGKVRKQLLDDCEGQDA